MDCANDGVNGVIVRDILPGGAFEADGRIGIGDYVLSMNNESFRRCTYSQVRLIVKRIQFLSTDIRYAIIFYNYKSSLI